MCRVLVTDLFLGWKEFHSDSVETGHFRTVKTVQIKCLGSYCMCMYVCIEAALRGIAHYYGRSNWAWRRGPSMEWIQCPNPAVPSIPRHAYCIILTHSACVFLNNLTMEAKQEVIVCSKCFVCPSWYGLW